MTLLQTQLINYAKIAATVLIILSLAGAVLAVVVFAVKGVVGC